MSNTFLLIITIIMMLIDSYIRLFMWCDINTKKSKLSLVTYILISVIPISMYIYPLNDMLYFYVLYFITCILQNMLIKAPTKNVNHSFRVRFVMFCAIHLFITGAMALFTKYSLYEVLTSNRISLICVFISFFIYSIIKIISKIANFDKNFVIHDDKVKEFVYLYQFLNINIIYIFLQALLCRFPENLTTNLGGLLCSNILSVFLVSCYIHSLLRILDSKESEKFHYDLSSSINKYNDKLDELRSHVHYDSLTGAKSRVFLSQETSLLLNKGLLFSLIYIDLNGLKNINDNMGHEYGDEYLCNFVKALSDELRANDTIARFGGDEFILLLPNCNKSDSEKRVAIIKQNICSMGIFSFSSGISDTTEANTLDELIAIADKRMYTEKHKKGQS